MDFTSTAFAAFVTIVFCLYYTTNSRAKQILVLIIASFVFYSWTDPSLLPLLIVTIAVATACIKNINNTDCQARARRTATLGVAFSLSMLIAFKYSSLILKTFTSAPNYLTNWLDNIPLPVGISFFTFQTISLILDAYRRRSLALPSKTRNASLTDISLYTAFFPQLVAGPIVKSDDFFPQIARKEMSSIRWNVVFRTLCTGYFLKLFVANNIKDFTFWIEYPYFLTMGSITLASMLIGYSMQIFADFAGYSLIAIGLGELFGYKLPVNFAYPYLSASFSEFWRRWHITLSSFLREYLYIPLGGNRCGDLLHIRNLILVMALGGLWHGANWTYLTWGLLHGVALSIEKIMSQTFHGRTSVALYPLRVVAVFFTVTVLWLAFKLDSLTHAYYYLSSLFTNYNNKEDIKLISNVIVFSSPVVAYHIRGRYCHKIGRWTEPLIFGTMLFLIFANSGSTSPFIYFQF